jgi:hypothetical protein
LAKEDLVMETLEQRINAHETVKMERKERLAAVSAKPVTNLDRGFGTEFWLMAQGIVDYVVPAFGVVGDNGELLVAGTREGAVYITKAQAMAFFNLVEPTSD